MTAAAAACRSRILPDGRTHARSRRLVAQGRWRQRVLLALVAALVTVIAEGWLFVRYADTTVLDARLRQGPPPRSVQGAIPASASIPGVITRASSESSLASTDTGASFEMTPLVRPAAAGAGVQPH